MGKIFISYRRADSEYVVGRIYEELCDTYGRNNIFKDIESIPLGVDFRDEISKVVNACDILIAIIGPQWISLVDDHGNKRIFDQNDFVRIEIEEALSRDIPVIPIITNNSFLPEEDDLPSSLKKLAYRNAIAIRPDPDFTSDIKRLKTSLSHDFNLKKSNKDNYIITALSILVFLSSIFFISKFFTQQSELENNEYSNNEIRMKLEVLKKQNEKLRNEHQIAIEEIDNVEKIKREALVQKRIADARLKEAEQKQQIAKTRKELQAAKVEVSRQQKLVNEAKKELENARKSAISTTLELKKVATKANKKLSLVQEEIREIKSKDNIKNTNLKSKKDKTSSSPYKGELFGLIAKINYKPVVNLYKKSSDKSKIIGKIYKEEFYFTHMQSGEKYWNIKTNSGKKGYIKAKYVNVTDERKYFLKATVKTKKKGSSVLVNTTCEFDKKGRNKLTSVTDKDVFYTYPHAKNKKCYLVKLSNIERPGFILASSIEIISNHKGSDIKTKKLDSTKNRNTNLSYAVDTSMPYEGESFGLLAEIIFAPTVELHKKESNNSEVIGNIYKNENYFTHMQSGKEYWHVKTASGKKGFIQAKYINVVDERKYFLKATVKTKKKGSKVLVRTSCKFDKAGKNILSRVTDEDIFFTYPHAKNKKCYLVKLPDYEKPGFISAKFIKILSN